MRDDQSSNRSRMGWEVVGERTNGIVEVEDDEGPVGGHVCELEGEAVRVVD
jgi:hypothetical protein